MADDKYQGSGGNLEDAVGGVPSGPNGDGTRYQIDSKPAEYSHESVQSQHTHGKTKVAGFFDRLLGGEKYKVENVSALEKKSSQELLSVGVENLDRIPEVARPYYVRMVNFVQGDPKKRFKDAEKGLDSLLNGLREIDIDMTKELYGESYESIKKPVGGLYGRTNDFVNKRKEYGDGVLEIDKEIKEANCRIESTKVEFGNTADTEKKRELGNTVFGIRFDIEQYERVKRELISNWKGVGLELDTVKNEINAIRHLQTYVQDLGSRVSETKSAYRQTRKNTDYTASILPLVDQFTHTLERFTQFGGAFDKANHDRLKTAAALTKVPVDGPSTKKEVRESPLADFAKKREGEDEEIMNQIKKVSKDPFFDLL